MAGLRAVPRSSYALVLAALMLSASILAGSYMIASGDSHDTTFYGCLYAGSLSQVNTTAQPANCGRGSQVSWNAQGPAGVSGYDVRESPDQFVEPLLTRTIVYGCGVGKNPISGGLNYTGDSTLDDDFHIKASYPGPHPSQWTFKVRNTNAVTDLVYRAYIICVDVAPDEAP